MKKIILSILILLIIALPSQALTQKETNKLITGTLITEHLKRKDCDPLLSFGITLGISIFQDIIEDNKLNLMDISYQCSGILVSYSFDEIANFLMSGIEIKK